MRQALVVGHDLIKGAPTGGVRIGRALVQEGQEGKSGGINTFAAVVARLVGLEQKRVKALGAEAFQVMEGMAAQGEARGFERGVEFAEERSGGKHIYICITTDI